MLAMFLFLGGWFFKDASTGYRQENQIYFLNRTFAQAASIHQKQQQEGMLTEESWKTFASQQTVDFGDDPKIIPATVSSPMPWPEELHDSKLLAKGQVEAWDAYTARMKWDRKAPEKLHEAGSIREQWYFAYALCALALYALFILLRTIRRSITIDDEKIITQEGRTVRLSELTRLDLRKWGTKGLAFAYYPQSNGKEGRIRIDGLTYGGFQKEQGEPAEALMVQLRAHFTGEIIEYAAEEPSPA
jgi:hypothetical protein